MQLRFLMVVKNCSSKCVWSERLAEFFYVMLNFSQYVYCFHRDEDWDSIVIRVSRLWAGHVEFYRTKEFSVARFKISTVVLLRIQLFWDVTRWRSAVLKTMKEHQDTLSQRHSITFQKT